ncbi:permease [Rickettsiales bacterium LUAb2]
MGNKCNTNINSNNNLHKLESSCCASKHNHHNNTEDKHCHKKGIDWLFISVTIIGLVLYLIYYQFSNNLISYKHINILLSANYELINDMLLGVILGIIAVFMLDFIPKPIIYKIIGNKKGIIGIVQAVIVGTIFDMCSHGVLIIASKLYKQGVRLPQIIAFLCATPWNSLSLTFVMIALIGLKLTVIFIVLSLVVAIITGLIFEFLLNKGYIEANPYHLSSNNSITSENNNELSFKQKVQSKKYIFNSAVKAVVESKMIIKWLLIGTLIAAAVRAFIPDTFFQSYLGPSVIGLLLTLIFAILLEICSQGSLPIATEFITKGHAVGNAFTFLMAGISTNYTQVMILRELTKSWKIPLVLLIVTLPQIIIIGYILNIYYR